MDHLHDMFVSKNVTEFLQLKSYRKELGTGLVAAKVACFVDTCVVEDEVANVVFVVVKVGCVGDSSSVTMKAANVVFVDAVVG